MTKKIGIYTPYRKGGPWYWGQKLARMVNQYSNDFLALHSHRLVELLASPLIARGDIIHSVNPITFRAWSKPYVLTIKGNYLQEKDNPLSRFYPAATKAADIVTVPSHYLKKSLGLKNAKVIPNAIEIDQFKPVKLKPNTNRPINILTVTKFYFQDKAEGVLEIIKALAILKQKGYKITYTVLGAGQFLESIKAKASSYSLPINFAGFQNPQDYFPETDIFAYYSPHDNMPNAVMEAMAAGLPVISNPIGAVPEIITSRQEGVLINDNYALELERLINDVKLRRYYGQNARKRIINDFSWESIIKDWLNLYEKL
ncbi:glycosyltransferase family 4 protein [Candidatus Berkelbacteria bacterium]|nr:glycosyltransferase family 4 protein [Candidatus Berkelbacteria bacterium]